MVAAASSARYPCSSLSPLPRTTLSAQSSLCRPPHVMAPSCATLPNPRRGGAGGAKLGLGGEAYPHSTLTLNESGPTIDPSFCLRFPTDPPRAGEPYPPTAGGPYPPRAGAESLLPSGADFGAQTLPLRRRGGLQSWEMGERRGGGPESLESGGAGEGARRKSKGGTWGRDQLSRSTDGQLFQYSLFCIVEQHARSLTSYA